jgi:hypothetical protein
MVGNRKRNENGTTEEVKLVKIFSNKNERKYLKDKINRLVANNRNKNAEMCTEE